VRRRRGALDANFPVPDGTLDVPGHDVYSWANGLRSSATTVSASTGDVMGYCFPVWASTYTYRAILNFRQTPIVAALASEAPAPITRVVVVRGSIETGRAMKLEPTFTVNARPALPDRSGPYRVDGLAGDGRVLFSYAFEPAVLDHAPNVRHFTLAVPATPDVEASLDVVRLVGPPGEARMTRAVAAPLPETAPVKRVTKNDLASTARRLVKLSDRIENLEQDLQELLNLVRALVDPERGRPDDLGRRDRPRRRRKLERRA
jgi:hypothetical protein